MDLGWITIPFSVLCAALVLAQALLLIPRVNGAVVNYLCRKILGQFDLRLEVEGRFFLVLVGMFWAKGTRFYYEDYRIGLRLYVNIKNGYLFYPIWMWFSGKVWIAPFILHNTFVRVEIYKSEAERSKVSRPLPAIGDFIISEGEVKNGKVFIEDTATPNTPPTHITDIEFRGARMDVAAPVSLLLFSRRAQLIFEGAAVQVGVDDGEGHFSVERLDLKKLAGLGSLLINTGTLSFLYKYKVVDGWATEGRIQVQITNFSHVFDSQFREEMHLEEWTDDLSKTIQSEDRAKLEKEWLSERRSFQKKLEKQVHSHDGFQETFSLNLTRGKLLGDFEESLGKFTRLVLTDLAVKVIQPRVAGRFRLMMQNVRRFFGMNENSPSSTYSSDDQAEVPDPQKPWQ